MDETFRRFCCYFLNKGSKEELEKLKEETGKSFSEYKKKSQKFIKNLKQKTGKLGFETTFESFCEMLEYYISKKDNMSDDEKKIYLKNLIELSQLYEINLRAELEKYVSYKEKPNKEKDRNTLFQRLCLYNLKTNPAIEEYNELQEFASSKELDYNEIQKDALMLAEEIRLSAEKLGFEPEEKNIHLMIQDYLSKKGDMTDQEKAAYLKVLFYLSVAFNINLRKELQTKKTFIKLDEDINKKYLKENLTNPLDDEELLMSMLKQRVNEGHFDLNNLYLPTDKLVKESKPYDYLKPQADLTYRLYLIFLDKFRNYAYNDLNSKYLNLITEEELSILENITREKILDIITDINKGEQSRYICKRYEITNNLYTFILLTTIETTDLYVNHIGHRDYSLFHTPNEKNNLAIYLNGPTFNTNLLLNDYIKKCVENNLNYDMQGLLKEVNGKKRTVIYSSEKDLPKKISILNSIANAHPELIENFGTPLNCTATIPNAFYSISHIGLINDNQECVVPYDEYINALSEVAYNRVLAKIVINKVTEESKKTILNDFISLENVRFNDLITNPLKARYNEIDFANIKELIEQYDITNTLKMYLQKETEIVEEFRKSLKYLVNIINKKDKKTNTNIALNF